MLTNKVSDMTIEELNEFVEQIVDRRLQLQTAKLSDKRSLDEIFASIDANRWTPPPDAKSSLELLREDRDR